MKHLKFFEHLNILKVGYYVFIHRKYDLDLDLLPIDVKNFIIDNVGKIIEMDDNIVRVKFFNIPYKFKNIF